MSDPPTRQDIAQQILNLAYQVYIADLRANNESEGIRLVHQLQETATEYESLAHQELRERGESYRPRRRTR